MTTASNGGDMTIRNADRLAYSQMQWIRAADAA